MLESLAGDDAGAATDAALRAIAIGCGDPSAAVRARALQLASARGCGDEAMWRAALRDDAPLVRGFAAEGCAGEHGEAARLWLLEALEREEDAAAFAALHAALAAALGVPLPHCDTTNEGHRAAAVERWRVACAR
jgi:hypothetical protein